MRAHRDRRDGPRRIHLLTIRIPEAPPQPSDDAPRLIDIGGAIRAVRLVPGLFALLLFSTFNNFLGGVFMSLIDPYGLTLVSVEVWGFLMAFTSLGFIVGGILVARRGLGRNPLRTLLLANVVMWIVTIMFPIRSEILPLAIGFFIFLTLAPVAEASEQTIIQKVVPFREQGRVFGFAQSLETAASPITAFLIGPIAQFWIIPSMTGGSLADDRTLVRDGARPRHGPDLHRRRRHRADRDAAGAAIRPVPNAVEPVRRRGERARRAAQCRGAGGLTTAEGRPLLAGSIEVEEHGQHPDG